MTRQILLSHVKNLHEKKTDYKCEKCGKKYFKAQALARHRKLAHQAPNYKCNNCGKNIF